MAALACGDNSAAEKDPTAGARVCPELPTECSGAPPSFVSAVEPIFQARCSSCHNPDDPSGPWPLNDPSDVADWSFNILDQVTQCFEAGPHAGNPITEAERSTVNQWFMCGALDN